MPQSSPNDECDFSELFDLDIADFMNGVSGLIYGTVKGPRKKSKWEREMKAMERVISLFTKPLYDDIYKGPVVGVCATYQTPTRYRTDDHYEQARHFRTRSELAACGSERLVQFLIDYEYIERHPKWPRSLKDHPQAPYRPIVSNWMSTEVSGHRRFHQEALGDF